MQKHCSETQHKCDSHHLSLCSIVRWFAKEHGVKLNKFIMYDMNTFYLVKGLRKRTYAVEANPDILLYKLPRRERGMSAEELLQRALQKVRRRKMYRLNQTYSISDDESQKSVTWRKLFYSVGEGWSGGARLQSCTEKIRPLLCKGKAQHDTWSNHI